MTNIRVIYTTFNNIQNAKTVVKQLLQLKLIACANIISNVTSMYFWKNEICTDDEIIVILKTRQDLVHNTIQELRKIHSYEIPCIIEINILKSHNEFYDQWILKITS